MHAASSRLHGVAKADIIPYPHEAPKYLEENGALEVKLSAEICAVSPK